MKDLDRDIRETLQIAAEAAAPEGYHDELEARVVARLEVQEMRGMDMSGANGSGDRTEPPPQGPAEGKSATTAKDEDSGLIDIKNMARSTRRRVTARHSTASDVEESLLASSRPSALRDVVLPEPGKEQPVQLATATEADAEPEPAERKGGGAWMLAVAAVVLIGGGAAAFFALRGGDTAEEARVAAGEAAGERGAAMTPPAAAGADDQVPAEPGAIAADLTDESDDAAGDPAAELGEADDGDAEASGDEPADDDGADRATDDGSRRDRGGKSRARKASDSNGKRRDRDAKKSDSDTADSGDRKDDGDKDSAKEAKPDKPKGKDLDSLLDFAAGTDAAKKGADEPKKDEREVTAKTKLSRSDVQQGMRSATARVAACYERFKVPGTVKIKVVIANTGVVTTASATGKFANTDTGACVAKAISQVSFPEFSGPSMSLTYPFLLQ